MISSLSILVILLLLRKIIIILIVGTKNFLQIPIMFIIIFFAQCLNLFEYI